jgi:hypothetical protein
VNPFRWIRDRFATRLVFVVTCDTRQATENLERLEQLLERVSEKARRASEECNTIEMAGDSVDLPILVDYDAAKRVGTARVSRAAFPTVDHVLALMYRPLEVQEDEDGPDRTFLVTEFEPLALGLIAQETLAPPGAELDRLRAEDEQARRTGPESSKRYGAQRVPPGRYPEQ